MGDNTVPNYWRTLAIVLLAIVVIESAAIYWAYSLGSQMVKNETLCSRNCAEVDAGSYYYDSEMHMCYCLDRDGELQSKMPME